MGEAGYGKACHEGKAGPLCSRCPPRGDGPGELERIAAELDAKAGGRTQKAPDVKDAKAGTRIQKRRNGKTNGKKAGKKPAP